MNKTAFALNQMKDNDAPTDFCPGPRIFAPVHPIHWCSSLNKLLTQEGEICSNFPEV